MKRGKERGVGTTPLENKKLRQTTLFGTPVAGLAVETMVSAQAVVREERGAH
jgi:hypothetical protein